MLQKLFGSTVLWLNVDRTVRNTNMLVWHNELWLIDHGAALYFHYSWSSFPEQAKRPFAQVKDHVLLPQAAELNVVDEEIRSIISSEQISSIVALIPDEWLIAENTGESPARMREVYNRFLKTRLFNSNIFVNQANDAREALI